MKKSAGVRAAPAMKKALAASKTTVMKKKAASTSASAVMQPAMKKTLVVSKALVMKKKAASTSASAVMQQQSKVVTKMLAPKESDAVVITSNGEIPVHSQVLALSSPVFNSMLKESSEKSMPGHLKLLNQSKKDFATFYQLLMPVSGRQVKISDNNLDGVFSLCREYKVGPLVAECEDLVGKLPLMARLLMAHKHGLTQLYFKTAGKIASSYRMHDLNVLKDHPKVLSDVVKRMKTGRSNKGPQL